MPTSQKGPRAGGPEGCYICSRSPALRHSAPSSAAHSIRFASRVRSHRLAVGLWLSRTIFCAVWKAARSPASCLLFIAALIVFVVSMGVLIRVLVSERKRKSTCRRHVGSRYVCVCVKMFSKSTARGPAGTLARMHKTDAPNNVAGEFSDGTPPLSPGTALGAKWHNTIQRELVNLVETKAGLPLDDGNDGQVVEALDLVYGQLGEPNIWTEANTFDEPITASAGQPTRIYGAGVGGSDSGLRGDGGSTDGAGVIGTGGGIGKGVIGTGGSAGGTGVRGVGTGSTGNGMEAVGAGAGNGLVAEGAGAGSGVVASGGASLGPGVTAIGGAGGVGVVATAGSGGAHGIVATGSGTSAGITASSSAGPGGVFSSGTQRGSINIVPVSADPSAPANGDVWYNSTTNQIKIRINGVSRVVTVT